MKILEISGKTLKGKQYAKGLIKEATETLLKGEALAIEHDNLHALDSCLRHQIGYSNLKREFSTKQRGGIVYLIRRGQCL